MFPLVTLQLWLGEALTARHALLTGKRTVSVSYDGKSVTYGAADIARLDAYITSLQAQIADATGQRRRRGPMMIGF